MTIILTILSLFQFPCLFTGEDQVICEGDSIIVNGYVEPFASAHWETRGDGYFLDSNDMTTYYYPGPDDIKNETVTIVLQGNPPCETAADSFDVQIIPDEICVLLPITDVINFIATPHLGFNLIEWEDLSDIQTTYELQRSIDAVTFETIAFLQQGPYKDASAPQGLVYYRLFDGIDVSKTIHTTTHSAAKAKIGTIYDLRGRIVLENPDDFYRSFLPAGIYILKYDNNTYQKIHIP